MKGLFRILESFGGGAVSSAGGKDAEGLRCKDAKRQRSEASIVKIFPFSGGKLRERVNLEDKKIVRYEGRLFGVNNLQSFYVIADSAADPQSQAISKTNRPSLQPSPIGEGTKPTYSPIHLFTYSLKKRFAFTLAEVLITLGIIGVVAALVFPSVITNYKKQQTVTKLKQTYSLLSQALTAAQAQYGDPLNWDIGYYKGQDSSTVDGDVVPNFLNKYLYPNLKIVKSGDKFSDSGYKGPYGPISKKRQFSYGNYFVLADGTLVNVFLGSHCAEENDKGECIASNAGHLMFGVDINGFKGNNIVGKEYFLMYFNFDKKHMNFFMPGSSSTVSRRTLLRECSSDGGAQYCGGLIQVDNWQIKDDYPWF